MDNQNPDNPNLPPAPSDPATPAQSAAIPPVPSDPVVPPAPPPSIPSGVTPPPVVDSEEADALEVIKKLKEEAQKEELADAKVVDNRNEESKVMEDIEKKDPKLVLTENATPPTDDTTPTENT
jgi:hypothetical protein